MVQTLPPWYSRMVCEVRIAQTTSAQITFTTLWKQGSFARFSDIARKTFDGVPTRRHTRKAWP